MPSEEPFRLAKAPIIEAVVEFHCELPPGLNRAVFEAGVKQAFGPTYPKLQTNYIQEYKIEAQPNQAPQSAVLHAVHGYRHNSEDGKQIVQTRFDGFFFNRLSPYSSLDDYLPEVQRCWSLYREVAQPVIVKQLALRYINRLLFPIVEGKLSLQEFLRHAPQLPRPRSEGHELTFTGFMHHHQMFEKQTNSLGNLIIAAQPIEATQLPVVVDITVLRQGLFQPEAWSQFAIALSELRALKNHIFKETITDKCLTLFQ